MGLLDDCEKLFCTRNLYEILAISADSSTKEIKKAYYKQSLKTHPDKVEEELKEKSNKLFQIVTQVYDILSDQEKRAVYDETGEVDDDTSDDKDWMEYWRQQFPKTLIKDILAFEEKYKGSEDEKVDLKNYYLRFKGDMNKISQFQLCYLDEEEDRYKKIIDKMIADKEVPKFKAYKNDSKVQVLKRKKKAVKEAAEAAQCAAELGLQMDDTDQSLALAIKKQRDGREKGFNSFLSDLEAKYCKPKQTAKGKKKN